MYVLQKGISCNNVYKRLHFYNQVKCHCEDFNSTLELKSQILQQISQKCELIQIKMVASDLLKRRRVETTLRSGSTR